MKNYFYKSFITILSLSFVLTYSVLAICDEVPPNTYFYPDGANEYFIELLRKNNIQHKIDYGQNEKIRKIIWNIEDDRKALEQALKVYEKIGVTKTDESIKMLSPEMNDRFETLLKNKNIPFTRKEDATYYKWKNWVEVQLLKRKFWKTELNKFK